MVLSMSGEAGAIGRGGPHSAKSLAEDLRGLGIAEGDVLLVHSSLSALGFVVGGAQAVVAALMQAVFETGTLVMPTFSGGLSDPANWRHPPVPEGWWEAIRKTMPAFDPARTPTRMMGAIPELFRTFPGVLRSDHPHQSFAAWGRHAAQATKGHVIEDSLGEATPLARLYELDASVLLLGVGHANNSSLHLSENRAQWPGKTTSVEGAPSAEGWVEWTTLGWNEGDFGEIGEAFPDQVRGRVGSADVLWFSQRALVDFGVAWMEENR